MQHGVIVETLTTADLCQGRARHPYTRLLVDATDSYSRDRATGMELEAA